MSVSSFLLISSCHTSSHSLPIAPIWYLIRALAAPLSWLQLLYRVIAAPELRFTGMSAFTAWLTAQISICSPIHDLKGSVLTMYGSSTFLSWSPLAQKSSLFLHALSSNFLTLFPLCCFWFLSCCSSFRCCLSIQMCSPHFPAPSGPPENFEVKPLRGKGTAVIATWDPPEEPNGRIRGQARRIKVKLKINSFLIINQYIRISLVFDLWTSLVKIVITRKFYLFFCHDSAEISALQWPWIFGSDWQCFYCNLICPQYLCGVLK